MEHRCNSWRDMVIRIPVPTKNSDLAHVMLSQSAPMSEMIQIRCELVR
jgi:hypothetical protein